MTDRKLPNWISAYVEYTKHLEAPDLFHMWTAIGTIGGALRGKCWIDMGYFKWKPNFFIILVAPPGIVSKSTTLGVGMSLLRQVPGIHFGPDSVTWQALTEAFVEAQENVKDIGPGAPLTIAASELGTFFDPSNREMVDMLCALWDGQDVPWSRRTKGEGESEIKNPWINFLSCTTPGWIEEHFAEFAIKGGFTSRTIFVYGDRKRSLVAYPGRQMDKFKKEFERLHRYLVHDLKRIALLKGQFHLTEDAVMWGEDWYRRHWELDKHAHLDRETHGGYIARKQTHIHKVAMVLSAATSDHMIITPEHMVQADFLVTQLERQMIHVFRHINDNRDAQLAMQILETLQTAPKNSLPRRELWKVMIYRCNMDEFDRSIRALLSAGYIQKFGEADSTVYRLPLRGRPRELDEQADDTATRWESLAPSESSNGIAVSDLPTPDPLELPESVQGQND